MNWKKVCGFLTKYPADSVEWCPFDAYSDYFLCGTYYLLEGEKTAQQERIGMIYLLKLVKDDIKNVKEIETDGILDMKWCLETIGNQMLVAAATAKGDVHIYEFDGHSLIPVDCLSLKTDETGDYMVLAVNWFKLTDTTAKISVTDNKGNAAVVLFAAGKLSNVNKWNAHSLEAWTIGFDINCSEILYTGGDDAKLKIWDQRTSAVKTLKSQNTGVTIIETNTGKPNIILTGSFDEILNTWDTRQMRVPIFNLKTSGGLWRVKCRNALILTANIYGGFQIIDFSSIPKILGEFRDDHASLAYGADWGKSANNCLYVGTCSFYDKTLCVSTWEF